MPRVGPWRAARDHPAQVRTAATWVMQHIVGKLSTSTFQRYKVCANRSSDGRVMTPGSRGAGAIFTHFSGEDSGQTGEAIGEPRVARRSWSRYLSNAPRLADQLVVSREDSGNEGGCLGEKHVRSPARFSLLFCLCSHAYLT